MMRGQYGRDYGQSHGANPSSFSGAIVKSDCCTITPNSRSLGGRAMEQTLSRCVAKKYECAGTDWCETDSVDGRVSRGNGRGSQCRTSKGITSPGSVNPNGTCRTLEYSVSLRA